MPRKARIASASSVYHVVIRGLDRQIMFESEKDYKKYLEIIDHYKKECGFELYAYCLMSNHVHLMIKVGAMPLDKIFRKINTHYAVWFNMKYQRTGHLQQERYYSEPIDDDIYFLNVIRYIHHNPANANLEKWPGESYPWNSVHEYLSDKYVLINSSQVFDVVSKEDVLVFIDSDNNIKCLDIDTVRKRLPDDYASEIICSISGCENVLDFQKIDVEKRNVFLSEFRARGLSIRQINRLTGIPRGVIQRVGSSPMQITSY